MVNVFYKNDGLIDEECNYLAIPERDRKKLVEMLDNFSFDDDIEINIIKFGTILREFNKDPRIRKDLKFGQLKDWALGKKIS